MRKGLKPALVATAIAIGLTLEPAGGRAAQPPQADPWAPVRFMVGTWQGRAEGQGVTGTAERRYAFVLGGRFLHETNTTSYPPRSAGQRRETHEHWSLISYDRARKAIVLRQFHQEGFVNQYVHSPSESDSGRLVFASEHFENFDNSWRARETYELRSADQFVETFELAAPGKELEVYSRTAFTRVKDKP